MQINSAIIFSHSAFVSNGLLRGSGGYGVGLGLICGLFAHQPRPRARFQLPICLYISLHYLLNLRLKIIHPDKLFAIKGHELFTVKDTSALIK